MKKIIGITVGLGIFLLVATAFAAPVLWLDISATKDGGDLISDNFYSLEIGESFCANIYISDLPTAYAMGFDVTYDATLMEVLNAEVADLSWPFEPLAEDSGLGLINFGAGAPLGSSVSGDDIPLGSIQFICLAPGSSDIVTGESTIGAGFFISEDIAYSSATINQVPIPSAVLLLGTGLVGLVGLRRRNRNR